MKKFFTPSQYDKNVSLKQFNDIKNKICILRSCGGFGDIINMRMIFEDIKTKYPEFHITWALPSAFFDAAKNHPFVDEIADFNNIKYNDFIEIYNLTQVCAKYEWTKGKNLDKNRSDIWAEHIGLTLENHKTHMPDYSDLFPKIKNYLKQIGWDGFKKIVVLAPKSALSVKDMTLKQCEYIKFHNS
jgi:hypothetical protein